MQELKPKSIYITLKLKDYERLKKAIGRQELVKISHVFDKLIKVDLNFR